MLAEAVLLDDPQALRAMLVALQAQLAARDRQIEALVDARAQADAELKAGGDHRGAAEAPLRRAVGAVAPDQLLLAL